MTDKYRQSQQDPNLLSLRDDISLIDARLAELAANINGATPQDLLEAKEQWETCRQADDRDGQAEALRRILSLISEIGSDQKNWSELLRTLDRRRRLVESERKRLIEGQYMFSVEQGMVLVDALLNAVVTEVADPEKCKRIRGRFTEILSTNAHTEVATS